MLFIRIEVDGKVTGGGEVAAQRGVPAVLSTGEVLNNEIWDMFRASNKLHSTFHRDKIEFFSLIRNSPFHLA